MLNTDYEASLLQQIRERSQVGYAKQRSILEPVLEACWCDAEDLTRAYEIVSNADRSVAVLLFQLPLRIRLPERWIRIPTEHGNPFAYFRTVGTPSNRLVRGRKFQVIERDSFGATEVFENAELPNDPHGVLIRTQVLMSFAIWEPRSTPYSLYLRSTTNDRAFKRILVDGAKSWRTDHSAMTCGMYEVDLFDRLALEAFHALRTFLKIYAVACRDPYALAWRNDVERLNSCFMMVQNGRLVVPKAGQSFIADCARPLSDRNFKSNLSALKQYLRSARKPTVYELYLLNAVEQMERGRRNLAVVQAVMVLDWFANELVEDHLLPRLTQALPNKRIASFVLNRTWEAQRGRRKGHLRVATMEKFREYFPLIGVDLPPPLIQRLQQLIARRNDIVHRRHVTEVSPEDANDSIEVAMEVIRTAMDDLRGARGKS